MPMAVSLAAHPDRVKSIYRKTVKHIAEKAGPNGVSFIEKMDSAFDALDKKDDEVSNEGIINCYVCAWLV